MSSTAFPSGSSALCYRNPDFICLSFPSVVKWVAGWCISLRKCRIPAVAVDTIHYVAIAKNTWTYILGQDSPTHHASFPTRLVASITACWLCSEPLLLLPRARLFIANYVISELLLMPLTAHRLWIIPRWRTPLPIMSPTWSIMTLFTSYISSISTTSETPLIPRIPPV